MISGARWTLFVATRTILGGVCGLRGPCGPEIGRGVGLEVGLGVGPGVGVEVGVGVDVGVGVGLGVFPPEGFDTWYSVMKPGFFGEKWASRLAFDSANQMVPSFTIVIAWGAAPAVGTLNSATAWVGRLNLP